MKGLWRVCGGGQTGARVPSSRLNEVPRGLDLPEIQMTQRAFNARNILSLAFIAMVVLPLTGCVAEVGEGEESDLPPGTLHEDTILVEDLVGYAGASLSEDLSSLVIDFYGPAADSELEAGNLVVGSVNGGYLRRVDAVAFDGSRAELQLSHATLEEAITNVRIAETWAWGERSVIDFSGRTLHESESADGGMNRVFVERGTLHFQPSLSIDAEIRFFSLKRATATLDTQLGQDLLVHFEAAEGLDISDSVDLETIEFPLEASVGPVTLEGKLVSTIRLAFEHRAEGPMSRSQSVDANGKIRSGGTYVKSGETWESLWEPTYDGQAAIVRDHAGDDWTGRAYVQVESHVEFKNIDGSSSRYELGSEGSADGDCERVHQTASTTAQGTTVLKLDFFSDGPRTEELPPLHIEADRVEGEVAQANAPEDCEDVGDDDDDDDDDDVDPGEGDFLNPTGGCAPQAIVGCGDFISGDSSIIDSSNTGVFDGYSCSVGAYEARETTFAIQVPLGTSVDIQLKNPEPTVVNHDLFILEASEFSCDPSACVTMGFNSVTFEAESATTYYLVVDGPAELPGAFEALITCS